MFPVFCGCPVHIITVNVAPFESSAFCWWIAEIIDFMTCCTECFCPFGKNSLRRLLAKQIFAIMVFCL